MSDDDVRDKGLEVEADDHDRRAILARRRRFVTIALASAGMTASCDSTAPPPCLSPIPVGTQEIEASDDGSRDADEAPSTTATAEAPPLPCLSPPPPPDDAGAGGARPDAGSASPDAGAPSPIAPKPPKPPIPQVCLRFVPPEEEKL